MTPAKVCEFVLPSGEFATFTPPTVGQHLAAIYTKDPIANVAAWCARIDGEAFSVEQWLAMDYARVSPIFEHVFAFYADVKKHGKGVA